MNAGQGLDVLAVATIGIAAQEIFSLIACPPDVASADERVDAPCGSRFFRRRPGADGMYDVWDTSGHGRAWVTDAQSPFDAGRASA